MLGLIILLLFDILVVLGAWHYSNKIKYAIKQNPKEAVLYGKNITVGIVAGIIVIILDRTINSVFTNFPKIESASFLSFILSIANVLLTTVLVSGIILFLFFFMLHSGLKAYTRKK